MGSMRSLIGRVAGRIARRVAERLYGPTDDPDDTIERMASNMEAESALWEKTATESRSVRRRVYAREKQHERADSARRLRSREEAFIEGIFSGMQGGRR